MFGGIVETLGLITALRWHEGCLQLTIKPMITFNDIQVGDSIAVNGVCLTVTRLTPHQFDVSIVPETLRCTYFSELKAGQSVNLERSLQTTARIGGHYVQGHIDGVGKILSITSDQGEALLLTISLSPALNRYLVPKGYITIDGMSLTIIEVASDWFSITLIPHTQDVTIAKHYQVGSTVNIEVDIMGKYIEKMIGAYIHVK